MTPIIRILWEDEADRAVPLPSYETTGAAGADIRANLPADIALKHGITLPNTPGTIDSDYRGPLGVLLVNLGPESYLIHHGDRIAQMIVAPVVQARFELTVTRSETTRGTGGCGSTGRG